MTIFYRLLAAHLLADFVLHGNGVYDLKKKFGWAGYWLHGSIYFFCILLCCMPYLTMTWWTLGPLNFNGFAVSFALVLLHVFADKTNKADNMLLKNNNLIMFLLWQLVLILILFIATPPFIILDQGSLLSQRFFIILDGALLSTYFTMVVFLLKEREQCGETYPCFDQKFFYLFYRLVLFLMLILPNYGNFVWAALWAGLVIYTQRHGFGADKMRMYGGSAITLCFAIMAKYLIQ